MSTRIVRVHVDFHIVATEFPETDELALDAVESRCEVGKGVVAGGVGHGRSADVGARFGRRDRRAGTAPPLSSLDIADQGPDGGLAGGLRGQEERSDDTQSDSGTQTTSRTREREGNGRVIESSLSVKHNSE